MFELYVRLTVAYICLFVQIVAQRRTHPDLFGLQELEAQILGQEIDCSTLEECEDVPAKNSPICGTNGHTYKSLCSFMRAICTEKDFEFKHHGECTASEKCLGLRSVALKTAESKPGVYIPMCQKDGTFASVQCHKDTKFCWCTTPAGLGVAGTVSYDQMPNCDAVTGSPSEASPEEKLKPNRPAGGCVGSSKKAFNRNMLQHMLEGFLRINNETFLSAEKLQTMTLRWKFEQLDANRDELLGRSEYRGIRKLVRQNVQPQKCAKRFPGFCDADADGKITSREWIKCFSTDETLANIFQAKKLPNESGKENPKIPRKGSRERRKPRPNCERDHQQSLESYQNGNHEVYIPKCERRGRYRPVQCYGSADKNLWFCFCVNVITGEMIQNTSVQQMSPVCSANPLPNPWPGCPPPHKEKVFLKSLLTFLSDYSKHSIPKKTEQKIQEKRDKRILEKIFKYLDRNKNGRLEGTEKRKLRNIIKEGKNLWTCGKKIHKVCDIDFDGRISLQEFFTCILPRKLELSKTGVVGEGKKGKRTKGENPFIELIKSE